MRRKAPAEDPLMTAEQVAEYIGGDVSVKTLYNWRSKGTGPDSFKAGGYLRYRRSSVDRWLAECGDKTLTASNR